MKIDQWILIHCNYVDEIIYFKHLKKFCRSNREICGDCTEPHAGRKNAQLEEEPLTSLQITPQGRRQENMWRYWDSVKQSQQREDDWTTRKHENTGKNDGVLPSVGAQCNPRPSDNQWNIRKTRKWSEWTTLADDLAIWQ